MKNDIFHCAKTAYTVSLSRCALILFFAINFSLFTFNSHAQGLTKYGKIAATGTDFVNKNGEILSSPSISKYGEDSPCPATLTINHLASGGVAPVDKTITYGVVKTSISGSSKCWITQNLGSTNQASSATDATEASAGWYWQFNRKQGFKIADDGTTRTPNTSWDGTDDNTYTGWDPAKDPCTIELGTGWRIPTFWEWFNADGGGSGVAWTGTAGAHPEWASPLWLHAAGLVWNTSFNRGYEGDYWSSTQFSTYGGILAFSSGGSSFNWGTKSWARSLRCLRD